MWELFWLTFYLAIPAFVANMIPIVAAKWQWIPTLDRPLDGGRSWRGHRVFGANKTWRGLFLGASLGMLIGVLYWGLAWFGIVIVPGLYSFASFALFGLLGGVGALLGDAIESFFKRQVGIAPGRPFIPFDQIDYLLGFIALTWLIFPWSLSQIFILLLCGCVLNPITNLLAYVFRIKKTYW